MGRSVGEMGLGTWKMEGALGGGVTKAAAQAIWSAAYDGGVTLFDTADGNGGGRSETISGEFLKETPSAADEVFVATQLGRRGDPGGWENYTRAAVRQHTEDSLQRLRKDCVDLTPLHCVPPEVLKQGGA